jgi:hypothetical protein
MCRMATPGCQTPTGTSLVTSLGGTGQKAIPPAQKKSVGSFGKQPESTGMLPWAALGQSSGGSGYLVGFRGLYYKPAHRTLQGACTEPADRFR